MRLCWRRQTRSPGLSGKLPEEVVVHESIGVKSLLLLHSECRASRESLLINPWGLAGGVGT